MLVSNWPPIILEVTKHIVYIQTPDGSGTGFLVANTPDNKFLAIATADHVLARALFWEQPIRVQHLTGKTSTMLRVNERAIISESKYDTCALFFERSKLPSLPAAPLPMFADKTKMVKVGTEVGWLGFPGNLAQKNLSFFSGRISAWMNEEEQYLVDGVAIHGVSGGPAFVGTDVPSLVGVVSAYLANYTIGPPLPGLCSIRSVVQFQLMVEKWNSLAQAQAKQASAAPSSAPAAAPASASPSGPPVPAPVAPPAKAEPLPAPGNPGEDPQPE